MHGVDSSLKALCSLTSLLVLAACSGGSGPATDRAAAGAAPVATVDAPATGAIVKQSPMSVEGEVAPPDATVMVDGTPAAVANGRFSASVPLEEGTNSIDIVATSAGGQSKTTLAVTLNSTELCGTGETFTTDLPGLTLGDDPSTEGLSPRKLPDDAVTLPKGCDVYAIFVHGYGRNGLFDELMYYKLAKWVAEHNGYVHWSWWNNFVAEYMARPLHAIPSTVRGGENYPTPGDITEWGNKWDFLAQGGVGKAVPDEDLQFQADAKLVLEAIRANNPNAIVIVAGHSMGGNAVIRLGTRTSATVDLLAPIDPVGNRNFPQGQGSSEVYATGVQSAVPGERLYRRGNETFNWTRWRATRVFSGWIDRDCVRDVLGCVDFAPLNPFRQDYHCVVVNSTPSPLRPPPDGAIADRACPDDYKFSVVRFGPSIKRLYTRWQRETFFPFDWRAGPIMQFPGVKLHQELPFDVKYHNFQRAVDQYTRSGLPATPLKTAPKTCDFVSERDPSGATSFDELELNCQDWDGHGEIIGMRATKHRLVLNGVPPAPTKDNLNPLAATADWSNGRWARPEPWFPAIGDYSACSDNDCRSAIARRAALVELAEPGPWQFAPKNPDLDLVVDDLVAIAEDLWAQKSGTPGGPDETPPTSTASLDVEPTAYGWNNTDVVAMITAVDEDGGSGVKEIVYTLSGAASGSGTIAGDAVDLAIGAEGETTIEYFARDNAGNEESPNTLVVKIDKTPPTIAASAEPPPNENGWNNTDVTVTFTGDDALSGIDTVTEPVTLTDEGANQEVVGVATDRAGNTAAVGVVVNIDKTPPLVSGLPESCELWPPNHQLVHVADVVVTDALSGVDETAVQGVSSEPESGPTWGNFAPDVEIAGGSVDLRAERYSLEGRRYDLTVAATDRAGNSAEGQALCTVPHDQGH